MGRGEGKNRTPRASIDANLLSLSPRLINSDWVRVWEGRGEYDSISRGFRGIGGAFAEARDIRDKISVSLKQIPGA